MILHEQGLDEIVVRKLGLSIRSADLSEWEAVVEAQQHPEASVKVGMVGKYTELSDAYKSINEALLHAGIHTRTKVDIVYIDAEMIEKHGVELLDSVDAILIPGGFGERGISGKLQSVQYAREHKIPYLGICLGMQTAVIEFARSKLELPDADSTEFNKNSAHPVVALVTEWQSSDGTLHQRNEDSDLGGTMRLGGQLCQLEPMTLAHEIYARDQIIERHRHRYEINEHYVQSLVEKGMIISGRSADNSLVEMIELADHPWFVGCQFQPEFTSTPRDGHPLFTSFVTAARTYSENKEASK